MGILSLLFKKKEILRQEDKEALQEIQRQAYIEEAKKLMAKKGSDRAKKELGMD